MGFFDFLKKQDFDAGLARFRAAAGALLLDVRDPDEYADGHIPDSVNLPLSSLDTAEITVPEKDRPLFVYCLSGNRSGSAVGALKSMGYTNVTNIGGIRSWRGEIER